MLLSGFLTPIAGASDTGAMTAPVLRLPFSLHPLMKEAKRRARHRRVRLTIAALVVAGLAAGLALAFRSAGRPAVAPTTKSPIRVALTAQNHQPRPSRRPNWHWWYSVKVRTAAGKPVAAPIHLHLQILSGRTPVEGVGLVSLKKGYDDWRAAIGGEANVLAAAPRGQKLVFQAVVRANGVTVKRNWPIVVR